MSDANVIEFTMSDAGVSAPEKPVDSPAARSSENVGSQKQTHTQNKMGGDGFSFRSWLENRPPLVISGTFGCLTWFILTFTILSSTCTSIVSGAGVAFLIINLLLGLAICLVPIVKWKLWPYPCCCTRKTDSSNVAPIQNPTDTDKLSSQSITKNKKFAECFCLIFSLTFSAVSFCIFLGLIITMIVQLYSVRSPGKVFFRDGRELLDVKLPWGDAFNLAMVYKWVLLGKGGPEGSELLNSLIKDSTTGAYKKWTEPWTDSNRAEKLEDFAIQKQISVDPWVWEKQNPFDSSDKVTTKYQHADDFFARKYRNGTEESPDTVFAKNAGAQVVHSLATCKIVAFNSVRDSQKFWIKNRAFALSDTGLPDWKRFDGHPMAIFRLAPYDYHRYHAPVSGRITHMKRSPNFNSTWSHSVKPLVLSSECGFNIFNENRRVIMLIDVLDRPDVVVGIVFVGAVQVDSIRFNPEIRQGHDLKAGDDLGSFHFGGSTVVFFTNSDKLSFAKDIIENSKNKKEFQVLAGEDIGRWLE